MTSVQTVFVIALQNHNFTQPTPGSSPEQLLGNPAAPYFNSLITPGNTNAAQVSYATHYYNAGVGVHGSEPNYVWAEAGSDFGVHTSSDPSVSAGNIFAVPHLTAELNAAGIPWRNFQEDVQYSSSPIISASGSGVAVNPYNGSSDYLYAVKHNPMAFFSDTETENVYPLTNFLNQLTNNQVGRYNWITPDEYNEMHTPLPSGFTYHGTAYTGDQAAVAEGDNFLSIFVPKIMASQAYRSNGLIIIWSDETEGGDTESYTLPEVIISPLAKGNAYASTLEYSHSSDLRSMLEIFKLNFFSNSIPASETRAAGTGYNNISTVNDFADLFANYVPPASFTIRQSPGSGFNLSFVVATNQSYRVLAAGQVDMPLSNWTEVASGVALTNPVVISDTNSLGARYYRVVSP
jgi:phosphatidylinositol-3-phosphatase